VTYDSGVSKAVVEITVETPKEVVTVFHPVCDIGTRSRPETVIAWVDTPENLRSTWITYRTIINVRYCYGRVF
jgi:hypothetical protein